MTTTVLSNVNNKYIIAKASTYGTKPTMTALDFGAVQSVTLTEDENLTEVRAVNSGHVVSAIEEGLYSGKIKIVTQPAKASMQNIFESILGVKAADTPVSGSYTITSSPVNSTTLSYHLEVTEDLTNVWEVYGLCITAATLTITKGSISQVELSGTFQKATPAAVTITPVTTIGSGYVWLDCNMTYGGGATILNNLTLNLDWNYKDEDSRGIEAVSAGSRRLIQRVIRNQLKVSGNFESVMDTVMNVGYADTMTAVSLVATMARSASDTHAFTITGVKTTNRNNDAKNENGQKVFTADFTGADVSLVGKQ